MRIKDEHKKTAAVEAVEQASLDIQTCRRLVCTLIPSVEALLPDTVMPAVPTNWLLFSANKAGRLYRTLMRYWTRAVQMGDAQCPCLIRIASSRQSVHCYVRLMFYHCTQCRSLNSTHSSTQSFAFVELST